MREWLRSIFPAKTSDQSMAKKKKGKSESERSLAKYYGLKSEAMDKLVNTDSAPEVSEEEIEQYRSNKKKKFRIPTWFKISFIKFWFSGAVCYFVLWGLGAYISGLDMMFVLAVALGIITDIMINNLLHHFEPWKGAYDKWMMIPYRKFWTVFLNAVYGGVLLTCIVWFYNVVNTILVGDVETADRIAIPVEPILFGLLYTGFDMLFITLRNTMKNIYKDARKKVAEEDKNKNH